MIKMAHKFELLMCVWVSRCMTITIFLNYISTVCLVFFFELEAKADEPNKTKEVKRRMLEVSVRHDMGVRVSVTKQRRTNMPDALQS